MKTMKVRHVPYNHTGQVSFFILNQGYVLMREEGSGGEGRGGDIDVRENYPSVASSTPPNQGSTPQPLCALTRTERNLLVSQTTLQAAEPPGQGWTFLKCLMARKCLKFG